MLNKKRTNNARKVKYLALVPMAAGLLLLNNIDAMARVLNEKVAEVIQQPTARHHYCFQNGSSQSASTGKRQDL